jgi:hypothetical protein
MTPFVARWKRAIARAECELPRSCAAFAVLDVATATSACFVPLVTPLLAVARAVALCVLVPAVLRALAIRHADRPDTDLVKAIAVAVGVAGLYLVVRTAVVVGVCAL